MHDPICWVNSNPVLEPSHDGPYLCLSLKTCKKVLRSTLTYMRARCSVGVRLGILREKLKWRSRPLQVDRTALGLTPAVGHFGLGPCVSIFFVIGALRQSNKVRLHCHDEPKGPKFIGGRSKK